MNFKFEAKKEVQFRRKNNATVTNRIAMISNVIEDDVLISKENIFLIDFVEISLTGKLEIMNDNNCIFSTESYQETIPIQLTMDSLTETVYVKNKKNITFKTERELLFNFQKDWIADVLDELSMYHLEKCSLLKISVIVILKEGNNNVIAGEIYIYIENDITRTFEKQSISNVNFVSFVK